MFETEKEITEAIGEKESYLQELRSQMDDDFDLYALEEYDADDGYESYTSSAPRNFFDKVQDGINSAEISVQIKLPENASEKERRDASLGEMYLFGGLNEIDRQYRRRGEPSLREQLAFFCNIRGWVALRTLVYPSKDGTNFDVLIWDILHTTWEFGRNGLLWVANKRKLTKRQIYSEYGIEITEKEAELIDWWDEVNNSILVNNKFVKKPTKHNLGYTPAFIGAVGSMPTLYDSQFQSLIQYRGDSVWAASRGLYEPFNRITSTTMDIYQRSVAGSLVHKSADGRKSIDGDPYKTYQEIKISEDEEITPLQTPQAPPETAILHSIMSQDIGQSTLPYPLAYGGTRQAMSGAALGILQETTRSVYNPRTRLIEQAYTWILEEFCKQFKNKGAKPVDFKGYTLDGKSSFFAVKVKPKEIDPEWYISVRCEPRMPRDKEAEIMMSLAATQKRAPDDIPLLSKQTAREDILMLKDPDAEEDKALEEMGEALPPIFVTKIAAALKERGKADLAQDVMMLLNPQAAQRQQQIPPELMAAAAEALASTGNPQMQQLALNIAQYVKGSPQQGQPQGQQGPPQAPQSPVEEQTEVPQGGQASAAPII